VERVPDPADSDGPSHGGHGLGPHVVGTRVVVRRLVRGEQGPTGGPAFTDVLGICEAWADGVAVVRRDDGERIVIETADIVSGKPVPPRASRASRLPIDEVERRAAAMLRPRDEVSLGEWLMRHDDGTLKRANSVLTTGDPGRPLDEALDAVRAFYSERSARPRLQVVVGSSIEAAVTTHGWWPAPEDGPPAQARLGSVAQVSRRLGRRGGVVRREHHLHPAWFLEDVSPDVFEQRRRLLEGEQVAFASVEYDGRAVAQGRAVFIDDWVAITGLGVHAGHRRRGLATTIVTDLVAWAGETGASMLLVQVLEDNEPALGLYDRAGLAPHHSYRYLVAPE
jgi:GNAT superfamily N-acetyltransferase